MASHSIDSFIPAFATYRKDWRALCGPFVGLVGLQVVSLLALILLYIGILGGVVQYNYDLQSAGPVLLVVEVVLAVILFFGSVLFLASSLKPLDEALRGKEIPGWRNELGLQAINSIKIGLFRIACILAFYAFIFAPFLLVALLGNTTASAASTLIIIPVMLLGFVFAILAFALTMFVELEVVLGGRGIFEAVSSSFRLVRENPFDVLLFVLAWSALYSVASVLLFIVMLAAYFIGFAIMFTFIFAFSGYGALVGIIAFAAIYLLAMLFNGVVSYCIGTPLFLLSLIRFWRSLAEKEGIVRDGWSRR